jgi:predicted TPR repeat methyltransferase
MRAAGPLCLLLLCTTAFAAAPSKPPPAKHKPVRPALDELFARLAKAESAEDAKPIEDQIFALFVQSGSPSVDLLMTRGAAALATGDDDVARKLFDAVTQVAPGFAEGWHQKAQLQADSGDDEGAMESLQKTVTLNPRQFAAMSELGDLLEEYGNKDGALKLYKRVLALDPQFENAAKHVRLLEKDVEGQGI